GQLLLLPRLVSRRLVWAPDVDREGAAIVRTALPFGAIAIATLAYYRFPTLVLGSTAPPAVVARYTIAATFAFGMVAAANAITTGLLPKLAAIPDRERLDVTRTALDWTIRISLGLAAVVVATGPRMLGGLLGPTYEAAFAPMGILLATTVVIGASGVL